MDDETVARWREQGVLIQKDKGRFILRMGICGGRVTAGQLRFAAALSEDFGASLHFTTRQTIEVQDIPAARVDEALARMTAAGFPQASVGPRLRTIVACPGDPVCRFSAGDTQQLARRIYQEFGGYSGLRTKIKLSITGCRNSCAKPQEGDIGFMALGRGRYRAYLGGKIGREPVLGFALERELADVQEVLALTGRVLDWLREHGQPKERLAAAIARLGRDKFLAAVEQG